MILLMIIIMMNNKDTYIDKDIKSNSYNNVNNDENDLC